MAAYAGAGDLLVQVADQLVIFGCVLSGVVGLVPVLLGLGAALGPHELLVVGVIGGDDGLGFQVPALAALCRAQGPGSFGAAGADGGEGVPAGDEHLLGPAGVQVGAPQLYGADAAAVRNGEFADDVAG